MGACFSPSGFLFGQATMTRREIGSKAGWPACGVMADTAATRRCDGVTFNGNRSSVAGRGRSMKRRAFILSLAATAFAPSAGHAQQSKKLPTIGLLGTATASVWTQWTTAFVQQLRELGWDEGRTVVIEYRWA